MNIRPEWLRETVPACKEPEEWASALIVATDAFGILSPYEISAFLAQGAHESSSFNSLAENLNYRWDRLAKIPGWKNRFPPEVAKRVGRVDGNGGHKADQIAIANIAYAYKNGNGSEQSGDGWAYRGSGILGLTGLTNFTLCAKAIGIDIVTNPGLVRTDKIVAAKTGAWFWMSNRLSSVLTERGFDATTKVINPGMLGAVERRSLFDAFLSAIKE